MKWLFHLGSVLAFSLSLLLLSSTNAYAGVVTYPVETAVYLASSNISLIVETGSSVDAVAVYGDNLVVTLTHPDTFSLRSQDRYQISNSAGLPIDCQADFSKLVIRPSSGTQTVTITPASQACTIPSTPVPTSTSNSATTGFGSPLPSVCTAEKPASAPDLFQISAKSASSTLFFSPSSGQWDRYFVSYSTNPSAQDYGFEFMNSSNGVVSVDVSSLKARTVYYFKIRAGNGCQPGDWSNSLSVQTGQRFPTYRWSALSRIATTAIRQKVQPTSIQHVTVDTATQPASPVPTGSKAPVSVSTAPAAKSLDGQQAELPAAPSFLQRVGNFFRGLWKK